jgi:hypothetical protein
MTKVRWEDDWPELAFHQKLADRDTELYRWIRASPRRALSADGRTLFVARRHGLYRDDRGRITLWDSAPVDEEPGMFAVDVFHANPDGTGYYQSQQLAPDVEILSLDSKDGALRVILQLREDQRVALELAEATNEVAWPLSDDGGLAREYHPSEYTAGGYLLHLAELLAVGGRPGGAIAREAAARRRQLDERQQRREAAHRAVNERLRSAFARHWRVEQLGLPQVQALEKAVVQAGLGPHREALRRVARPCWSLISGAGRRGSRIGGVPDLARGTAWPTRDGELFHFIAQINLAELPALSGAQMPRQGLLSLFTGMLEPANDVEHLVLYTPEASDAAPTRAPRGNYRDKDLHIEGSLSLIAKATVALPGYSGEPFRYLVNNMLDPGDVDRYFTIEAQLSGDAKETPSGMLGFPDAVGARPEAAAFFLRAGRPDSRFWLREELDTDEKRAHFDHVHEHLEDVVIGLLDWIPLFRLRSYSNMGLTFWDAGTLNVMIHRDDLAALRFDRTVAVIAT